MGEKHPRRFSCSSETIERPKYVGYVPVNGNHGNFCQNLGNNEYKLIVVSDGEIPSTMREFRTEVQLRLTITPTTVNN